MPRERNFDASNVQLGFKFFRGVLTKAAAAAVRVGRISSDGRHAHDDERHPDLLFGALKRVGEAFVPPRPLVPSRTHPPFTTDKINIIHCVS